MRHRHFALATLPLLAGLALMATRAQASTLAIDAVSGSSISVKSTSVTTTTAKLTFSETEVSGSLRLYYGTTSIAAADTSKATTTKISVTSRGNASVTIPGLTAGTTYFYYFQGYFENKNPAAYSTSGSVITTATGTGIHGHPVPKAFRSAAGRDALGRPSSIGSGIRLAPEGATPTLQGASH